MEFLLLPFIVVLAVSYFIGARCAKETKNEDQYFLANRSLGWGLLTMTLVATQIGGGFVLGTSDAALEIGPYAVFFPLGYALGFLGLGLGIGNKLRELNLSTASEVFQRFYESPLLKRLAAILSVVSLTGILIAQAIALKSFLGALGITQNALFVISWAVVILYTTQGGFLAVVWTDTLQAAVMIVLLIVTFFITLQGVTVDSVASLDLAPMWEIASPRLLGYILIPLFFTFIEQDMVQRCFAARSKRDITIAGLLSAAILVIMSVIPVGIGTLAKIKGVEPKGTSTFMEMIKLLQNPLLLSAAASATLLAIISTASSLLSAVSSNIIKDFFSTKEKSLSIRTTKIITFGVGCVAFFGAFFAKNILSCMISSYELSVAALLIPFMGALFLKDRCKNLKSVALMSAASGVIGFIGTKMLYVGIFVDVIPLFCSLLIFVLGFCYVSIQKKVTISAHV